MLIVNPATHLLKPNKALVWYDWVVQYIMDGAIGMLDQSWTARFVISASSQS